MRVPAGRPAYALGTMALACLGRTSQPLICCRVRMKTCEPTGGTPWACPPKDATAANRPCAGIATGYLTLTYTRAKAATDVSPTVEQSNDLATWHSGTNYVQEINLFDQASAQLITVQAVAPVSSNANNFLRLRTTRLP